MYSGFQSIRSFNILLLGRKSGSRSDPSYSLDADIRQSLPETCGCTYWTGRDYRLQIRAEMEKILRAGRKWAMARLGLLAWPS